MLNELRKSLEGLPGINAKDLYKSLRVCKLETQTKTQKCSEEGRKVKSSYCKSHILENNQSYILGSRTGPGWLSVRSQVIWKMDAVVCWMGTRRSGHILSPLESSQKVICR